MSGSNVYNYVFHYTDHLGNIRVSYAYNTATSSLKIIEENHYYPFGLKHTKYNTDSWQFISDPTGGYATGVVLGRVDNSRNIYQYKYNGKEFQDELGLNMYDYGARNYDAALGRWMNMDSMSEKYFGASNYAYVLNSPVIFIDPDGNEIRFSFIGMNKDERIAARNTLEQIFNQGFNGFATAHIDDKGNLTIENTDKEGLNDEENSGTKVFLETISSIDERKEKTKIGVKSEDGKISMGDWDSGVIDLDDISKVGKMSNRSGERNAISSHGKLGHEIFEQFLKQVEGVSYYDETENGAHLRAYHFEDQINGVQRQPGDEGIKVNKNNPNFGESTFRYKVDGTIVKIKYTYDASSGKGAKIFSVSQSKN